MKIHLEDELEKKDANFHLAEVEVEGALDTQPPILNEQKIATPSISKELDENTLKIASNVHEEKQFRAIPANKVHGNMSLVTKKADASEAMKSGLPAVEQREQELVLAEQKNILPSTESKSEAVEIFKPVVSLEMNTKDIIEPVAERRETVQKDDEISHFNSNNFEVEDILAHEDKPTHTAAVRELKPNEVQVGAAVTKKKDISSFRNELVNDLDSQGGQMNEEEKMVETADIKGEPPVNNQPEIKSGVPSMPNAAAEPAEIEKSVENDITTPQKIESDQSKPESVVLAAPSIENNANQVAAGEPQAKPASLNPNWADSPDAGGKIEKTEGNTSAFMIESTVSEKQEKQIKGKKIFNVIVTIVVILALAAAGYTWGWPILKDIIGG